MYLKEKNAQSSTFKVFYREARRVRKLLNSYVIRRKSQGRGGFGLAGALANKTQSNPNGEKLVRVRIELLPAAIFLILFIAKAWPLSAFSDLHR